MKRVVLILFVGLFAHSLKAQPPRGRDKNDFITFQIELLAKQMELDEALHDEFATLYKEYSQKERSTRGKQKGLNRKAESLSEEELETQILESFDTAQSSIEIRREYYKRFRSILSPKQILKMYNTEKRIRDRIDSEHSQRAVKKR